MEKQAFIYLGLPLSGKSTHISEKIKNGHWINSEESRLEVVSADTFKENHPDYDPDNAHLIHLWSVEKAETAMNKYAEMQIDTLIMDGGGINDSYTRRIIKMLKDNGYKVGLIHIKTPLQICLLRNGLRTRKVPAHDIISKAAKEKKQFTVLAKLCDSVEVVPYFTNKHIFVDMDGVLAGLSLLPEVNGRIDFVNSEIFTILAPVKPVIEKLQSISDYHNIYVLSAIPNSFSYTEKNKWLDKYFNIPVENRFFVNSGKHKALMLENLMHKMKLRPQDITLIEDTHTTLKDARNLGFNPIHVSEFLTDDFLSEDKYINEIK